MTVNTWLHYCKYNSFFVHFTGKKEEIFNMKLIIVLYAANN